MTIEIKIPCSSDQEEVIAEHLLYGGELGILPDERAWIKSQVSKQVKGVVVAADLDIENATWVVQVTVNQ